MDGHWAKPLINTLESRAIRSLWRTHFTVIVQELCESRGGRPGLSVLTSLLVSVDVKNYWTVLRHWSQLVPNKSADIWGLSLHCHHQNDSCIKMGSDESHFNASLTVRDKDTRQCPQTTTFEEKGEQKRNRTEVPLPNALPLGQTGSLSIDYRWPTLPHFVTWTVTSSSDHRPVSVRVAVTRLHVLQRKSAVTEMWGMTDRWSVTEHQLHARTHTHTNTYLRLYSHDHTKMSYNYVIV